jgi:hypothetical protein|tara:strand:+ start:480 stop:704 length:225 start_codon:yes stop_codon:yes gene_type:complete
MDKMEKKQKKYEERGVVFGKDGKPTKESRDKAKEEDNELFLDLQNDYFTTKGSMGDFNLRKMIGDAFKSNKEKE